MCDKADDSLAALKLIPDCFFTSKMIKKLYTALYADENILYFNKNSENVVFSCNGMGILNMDLNNINRDNNFDEDHPDAIILIRLLAWYIKFEKSKELRKMISEELMPIAWHPNRWWNFCVLKDENKNNDNNNKNNNNNDNNSNNNNNNNNNNNDNNNNNNNNNKRNTTNLYWVMLIMYKLESILSISSHFNAWYSSKIFVNSPSFFIPDFDTNVSKYILENI